MASTYSDSESEFSNDILQKLQQSLPFLPGHQYNLPSLKKNKNERKSHAFDYCNGVPIFKGEAPGIGGVLLHGQEQAKVHTSVEVYPKSDGVGVSVPAWVAFDRKVLRFYAYFQEAVHEKREEQYRVRKVNIYFYLEDDTVHVSEPKTANSGIPQGTLIARHRIPKGENTKEQHYIVSDFNVGKEVTFYSRTFKIVGCDKFTREFISSLDISVPKNEEFPTDPYQLHRDEMLSRMKPTRPTPKQLTLKKFLENDRRVLRFYCVWDDTNSVFGDIRHMIIHYYLSDDTIEIRESIPINSGRESNTLFLRRCRLPKRPHVARVNGHVPEYAAENYTDRDFAIGSILHLYGRPFVVCDCDEFTKCYYAEKYGLEDFDPVKIDESPDYNYDDIDSSSIKADELPITAPLIPQPPQLGIPSSTILPKKDFKKLMMYDGVALRFSAVLKSNKQVDRDRKFVISFYVADDTISVFEPHQRNSGIIGGKFLEKQLIKKKDGDGFYASQDFYIGAELDFFSHCFILTDADEYAVNFMAKHPELFPKNKAN